MGSFFVDNAPPQNTGVTGGSLGTFKPAPPTADPQVTTQPQPSQQLGQPTSQGAQGDPKTIALQYAQSLGPPSPENIQKTADYMKSLGFNVQANPGSDGFFINGVGVDMVSNFHGQGPQNWQFNPDSPIPGAGGSLGNMGDPSGFQTGTFTGGGKYPLASVMGTGLAQPWTTPFNAPDNLTEQNDPGFQARMKMGTDALERSAASKGTLLTGGMMKDLNKFAQDYASNEYGNVYNRALGQYQQAYGIFNNNQGNLFNRLGSLANIGENAAAGTGSLYQDQGNSQSAGTQKSGDAWSNTIGGITNAVSQYPWSTLGKPKATPPFQYSQPQQYSGAVPGD